MNLIEFTRSITMPEDTFDIELSDSMILKFRRPRDASEVVGIARQGDAWMKALKKTKPAQYKPFMPSDDSIYSKAYFLSCLSVEPKIEELEALEIAKTNGLFFLDLFRRVDEASSAFAVAGEMEALEAEGEGSGATDIGDAS